MNTSQSRTVPYTAVITLLGTSGKGYTYFAFPLPIRFADLPAVAGNYAFAVQQSAGYGIIYVGETGDFSTRFQYHHKLACAHRHGMTHLLAHITPEGQAARLLEEADLKASHNPPCND